MEKELLFLKYNITHKKYYCLDKYNVNFEEVLIEFNNPIDVAIPSEWYIELRIDMLETIEFHFEAYGFRNDKIIILEDPFITMVIDKELLHDTHPLSVLVGALTNEIYRN